mmetsp:Transcript_1027/g.2420  ORF Transcript_1027/g.2420 Transcript_1027/m.2420 type:complete len:216 (-) Transcript_1027:212-859(-)
MGGSGAPMDTIDGIGAGIMTGADGTLATAGEEDAGARLTRVFILPDAAFINAATMPSGLSGFAGDSAICAAAGAAPTLALLLALFGGVAAAGAAAGACAALGAAATGSGPLGTGWLGTSLHPGAASSVEGAGYEPRSPFRSTVSVCVGFGVMPDMVATRLCFPTITLSTMMILSHTRRPASVPAGPGTVTMFCSLRLTPAKARGSSLVSHNPADQ